MTIAHPRIIAVGSRNPVKLAAVRDVLAQVGLQAIVGGVAVPAGVAVQPIGQEETIRGARQRASVARAALGADWGIGFEGGVEFDAGGGAWMFTVALVETASGRESQARSGMLLLPPLIVERLRAGEELGPLIDELAGPKSKEELGAIGFLTSGALRREDLLRATLSCALAPLLHPNLYRWDV